jgi:hypothetical protein
VAHSASGFTLNTSNLASKVLVLDEAPGHAEAIKQICDEHNLIALKVRLDRILPVLDMNIDLGGIFLSEDYGGSREHCVQIIRDIHQARPELPLFIRCEVAPVENPLPVELQRACKAYFSLKDLDPLRGAISQYIFSQSYPASLVKGFEEISIPMLSSVFSSHDVRAEAPCIVHDRIIFGEVFSLIPLEGSWCRGYMMIQAEENPVLEVLADIGFEKEDLGFRDINSLLGETTNLIWGAFKNRYLSRSGEGDISQVQVPLIINHLHKYISFGTENPQLCFTYRLTHRQSGHSFKLVQRFVFNLRWIPEEFHETVQSVESFVQTGELEFF